MDSNFEDVLSEVRVAANRLLDAARRAAAAAPGRLPGSTSADDARSDRRHLALEVEPLFP